MKGFYNSKTKYIKCKDCRTEIERLTPNHKRCKDCGYEISKKRAREASDIRGKEKNAELQRDWYYRNREKKIKQVMEYQRKYAPKYTKHYIVSGIYLNGRTCP